MKKKITQQDIAKYLGISTGCLSKIKNGKTGISSDVLKRISDRTGISADVILSKGGNILYKKIVYVYNCKQED